MNQPVTEFLKIVNEAKKNIKEITVTNVAEKMRRDEKFYFVDVREDNEVAQEKVRGAIHIGKGVIERDVEKVIPDKSAEIILYCGSGARSALAADSLKKMGYTNVMSMNGGYREWLAGGLPTEKLSTEKSTEK